MDPVQVPFSTPILFPVPFDARGYALSDLSFDVQSTTNGAVIRDGSFYWTPGPSQTGTHSFDISIRTSDGQRRTGRLQVTVQPFNRPPQFVPVRPVTLAADTFFETALSAFDPDGKDRTLVRYLGIDLPAGALLNEKNGHFTWTPTRRQMGEHEFRVIATDQYGAASELRVQLRVEEVDQSSEYPFESPKPDN